MTPSFSIGLVLGLALSLLTLAGAAALLRQFQRWSAERLERNPGLAREAQQRRQGRESFLASLRRLDAATGGQRYRVPWCLVVGAEGSGRRTLLARASSHRSFGTPRAEESRREGHTFWLLERGAMVLTPAVGAPAGDWRSLLRRIRRARPERPVDNVLLTISCADLVGPAALGPEAARRQADALYQALRRIHRELGMRVPVYVLVTRCDVLPGFQGFCRTLPDRFRDEMLGWSSPYAFETPYASGWVDEALSTLHRSLCLAQVEALTLGRAGPREQGDLLLLPAGLGGLAEPLRRFLDPLFLPGAYHEPILLRGIYFCGDLDGPATSGGSFGPEGSRCPAFVSHLLDRKIFPERGLARPEAGSRAANHRALRALQGTLGVCLLLTPLALWSAVDSLRQDLPPVMAALEGLAEGKREFWAARGERRMEELKEEELKLHAEAALRGMSRIRTNRLSQPFLPTSWFSGLEEGIQHAMRTTFEDIILSGFRVSLERSRQHLLGEERRVLATRREGVLGPDRAPELLALRSLERELGELSERIATYNGLRNAAPHQKLELVGRLANGLFGLRLGADFTHDAGLYEGALDAARYVPCEAPTPEQVRTWAWELADLLRSRLLLENPLEQDLKELADGLTALKAGGHAGNTGVQAVRRVAAALDRARADAEDPDAAWLAAEELGSPFTELLETVRAAPLLGEPMARELEPRWRADFKALRERLLRYEAPVLGRLLYVEEGKLALSPRAASLRTLLGSFLAQPYVQSERGEPVPAPGEGPARVLWNVQELKQASRLAPAYEAFLREELEKAPEELRGLLGTLAREQLQRGMRERVARARRVEPLPAHPVAHESARAALTEEVARLGQATAPLRRLLDTYDRLELSAASLELRGKLATEAEALLRRVDALLEEDRLYVSDARLEAWHGEHPAALAAFAVADAEALSEYLKTQRARMDQLSRELAATPVALLEVVLAGRPAPPLLSKWRRIAAGLHQRESLVPGNSVQVLETFIQSDLMSMSRGNCLGRLAPARGEPGDFFLARREALRELLRRRCEGFSTGQVVRGYQSLAKRFNRTLAGHYPFALRDVADPEQDASPRELRDFLRELDAYLPVLDAYLARSGEEGPRLLGPAGPDILAFLARMRTLRNFFLPLLEDESAEPVPAFAVGALFRVNRRSERGASGIIEWRLEVGGERFEGEPLRWQSGEPLRVSLRWAKDGPYLPARSGQPRGVHVGEDGTVFFEYGGPWALLRLAREHGLLRRVPAGADPRAPTLGFVVALEPRRRGGARVSHRFEGRAFLQLIVRTPDGKSRLGVPREWPTRAPVLPQAVQESP